MASPDANRLTRQHRDTQAAIGRAVARPVRQLARQASTADIDSWFARVLPRLLMIIRAGWIASATHARQYLELHAEREGVTVDPVRLQFEADRVIASLRVTGPVAFKEHVERTGSVEGAKAAMVARLPAAAARQVMAGGRETIERTAEEDRRIVGWRRVTDADPCAFCAMLASRGAVYLTRESASGVVGRGRGGTLRGSRQRGEPYHDGCECTVAPLYEHEPEPPEVVDLENQWLQATAGHSGKAAIRAWRQYWDKQRREGDGGG